jgi:hypothetical protein
LLTHSSSAAQTSPKALPAPASALLPELLELVPASAAEPLELPLEVELIAPDVELAVPELPPVLDSDPHATHASPTETHAMSQEPRRHPKCMMQTPFA